MKKVTVLFFAITAALFSCNQYSNKEVKEAGENLTEAKTKLKEAIANENDAAKEKETAEWRNFRNEADSSITHMENDLKKIKVNIEKASKKSKLKLKADYAKANSDMAVLKEKLHQKNIEFENDIKSFDKTVSENNLSFKREFNHDMEEFGKSLKDLFKDNVK